MKKIFLLFIFLFCFSPLVALAQAGIILPNPLAADNIPEFVALLCDLIFYVGLALVALMIIIGGVMLILATGDPEKVATAKRLFFWTGIGTAIILLAEAVSGIIKYILGG